MPVSATPHANIEIWQGLACIKLASCMLLTHICPSPTQVCLPLIKCSLTAASK